MRSSVFMEIIEIIYQLQIADIVLYAHSYYHLEARVSAHCQQPLPTFSSDISYSVNMLNIWTEKLEQTGQPQIRAQGYKKIFMLKQLSMEF